MKNRIFKVILIFLQISFFLIVHIFNPTCLINRYFNIECPGCGLTRAFQSIINFRFLEAIEHNILSIPLFIIILIINIILIYDILTNKTIIEKFFHKSTKYYKLIIILLILSMFINNIF